MSLLCGKLVQVVLEQRAGRMGKQRSAEFLDAPGVSMGLYAAAALGTLSFGLETTNRNEGWRLLGLATRTAASSSLKALRFMVATFLLWWRRTLLPRNWQVTMRQPQPRAWSSFSPSM
jgi:hypothetical protein